MRAVTFQAPGEVRVEEVPEPELIDAGDAIVQIEATGVCGSDLHIYHGRVPVEPGFTIGHEFVGTVLAAGSDVDRVAVGDRVLGCFHTACGTCVACVRGDYHRCVRGRTFGHGAKLGDLQGAQAELLLVPNANLTLRRVPEGMSADVALFAGDVMGTGYHAVAHAGTRAGDTVAVLGAGQSALETSTLFAEAGTDVRLLARADTLYWPTQPRGSFRKLTSRLRDPLSGLGEGWRLHSYAEHPLMFHALPASQRLARAYTELGPAGSWWLRPRFERTEQRPTDPAKPSVRRDVVQSGLSRVRDRTDANNDVALDRDKQGIFRIRNP